ncbi:hypothetical protein [Rhodocyclus tenuis]|uniref:HAP2 n=1 Tax=Rhodocyclus tenuis TaxID=1066 RepID=A0A840G6J4_RHOTE|nr:hypothetical protein [Rhodocyclus tenuis]MBB4247486.1 hypothetical protein [Rhodocyclus tenuis]
MSIAAVSLASLSQSLSSATINTATTSPSAASSTDGTVAASNVSLQATSAAVDPTYSFPQMRYSWASSANDDISEVMRGNLRASAGNGGISALLKGLGSSLLGRFSSTQTAYSQVGTNYISGGTAGVSAADAVWKAQYAENTISLTLTTTSNKQVTVAIAFDQTHQEVNNSLSVQISSTATLTQEESAAIAALATGFETALQGIGRNSTTSQQTTLSTIDVSGLMDFDPAVLASVDLKVSEAARYVGLKSLDFHADSSSRRFAMKGIDGDVSVKVDLSQPLAIGSKAQQQASIERYLKQFDAANARAQGEAQLVGQFKSIFSQLHSSYPTPSGTAKPLPSAFTAAREQWLSGLADFQASMSGEFSNGLSGKLTKSGELDYLVSQKTTVISGNTRIRAAQSESAALTATIMKSRNNATLDIGLGNYDVFKISDSSSFSSGFSINVRDDYVETATLKRIVSQLMHYEKIVNYKAEDTRETAKSLSDEKDLLAPETQGIDWRQLGSGFA